jgi:transmembrane sensor
MKQLNPSEKHIADAIECFQCLIDPKADPEARARWVAWLGANPEHRAAYKKVEATWRHPIPNDLWPSQKEIDEDTYDPDISVEEHNRKKRTSSKIIWAGLLTTRAAFAGLGLATVLLAGVVIGVYLSKAEPNKSADEVVYRTQRGEQRRIALDDGSIIVVGPLSEVRLPQASRTVELVRGEAYFTIVHDPAKPFEVAAGSGHVRDVGTAFNIALQSGRVVVTVADGAVSVSTQRSSEQTRPVLVGQNQQVAYTDQIGTVSAVDASMTTDWTRGRLAYVDRPLADVAAELSRFSKTDVTISDPSVGALRYTGIVDVDAIDHWATSVAKVYPVRVERSGTRLILESTSRP